MTGKAKRPTRNDAPALLADASKQRKTKRRGNGSGTVWWDVAIGKYRWQITLQTLTGGRRKTLNGRAETKTGAVKAMRAALVAHEQGDLQDPNTITVARYAEVWLNRLTTARPRTLALYRQELGYALAIIGGERVQKVTVATMKDLVAGLSRREMAGGLGRGKPMSPRTLGKIVTRLRAVFAEAVTDGIIKVSPMNGVRRQRVPSPAIAPEGRVLDEPQLAQFHALGTLLWQAGLCRLWPALFTALSVGLRRGEVLGLTWAHVELAHGLLRIQQQITGHRGGARVSDLLKTDHARRDIHMPLSLVTLLKQHQAQQRAERTALGLPWTPDSPVFATASGTFTHPDNFNRALSSMVAWSRKGAATVPGRKWNCPPGMIEPLQAIHRDRGALPQLSPHDLRHTYATTALRRGIQLAVVSKTLGHARVSITNDIYRHVLPSEAREQVIDLFTPPDPQD
ncbi:site-specific integrase [Deinococcus aerolatus]|uniref:Site-specific integrase n=1 Tax=Deinococcus aerolatus TaxID=522487 RepID=A0ABQ2G6C3_9DEIO|nr:site-specific integrase [Deinococcus aerolatus]GGL77983.1 site-specific integrase [Deinococcus aerolatus]